MINKFTNYLFFFTLFITIIFSHNSQNATEILLYADDISYDEENNIIARGKAKILFKNKVKINKKFFFNLLIIFNLYYFI